MCEGMAGFRGPAADRLAAGLDAALRPHLLDVPEAGSESDVETDRQPCDEVQ
jgi:hypothetical protein